MSSVSAHVSVCVRQTMQPDLLVVSDGSSIVADKHGCIIFVCNNMGSNITYNDIHTHMVSC